jgi:hypothetical protein
MTDKTKFVIDAQRAFNMAEMLHKGRLQELRSRLVSAMSLTHLIIEPQARGDACQAAEDANRIGTRDSHNRYHADQREITDLVQRQLARGDTGTLRLNRVYETVEDAKAAIAAADLDPLIKNQFQVYPQRVSPNAS